MGNPVWQYAWVTGDALGGPNPWYAGSPNLLVWDPEWFGQVGNGNWVVSNDTAPSQARGGFLTPGNGSAARVSALRWIAPESLPNGLLIDGSFVGDWTNNASTYQIALAKLPGGSGAGAQLLFSDTISSIWHQFQHPLHVRVPVINAGDVIVFTARATADHGWWTIWNHDFKLKVTKAPTYPIGFSWNRRSEFVQRPDYDANTTYGNPALDSQDQPVWEYVHTAGGAVNSPNPWFVNQGTKLVWDPSWFGQTGNGNWVASNDNAPAISAYSTYGVNTPSALKIGVVRWTAPATLPGGLRITGNWSMRWENATQPYEGVIARLPGGGASDAQVLATRTFTIDENDTPIPVDIIVPVVNQGDVIVVSARATADHGWYAYFQNDLTFTHNCPDVVFTPSESITIRRVGDSATLNAPAALNPPLATFPLSYQWQRSGVAIANGTTPAGSIMSGATTDSLTITNLQAEDSGEYSCVVTTSCRNATSSSQTLAVYPISGMTWKRSTDWITPPTSAAGTTQGNPNHDSKGVPVWDHGYVFGGRLNSPDPWFYAVPTRMVWDPSWYGQSGVWAVGDDANPPIGSGALTDNRTEPTNRIPVVRWIAPLDLPGYLGIEGSIKITWSGGGDAPLNTAPADLVIARQSAAGGEPVTLWSVNGAQRPSCSFIDCPTQTFFVSQSTLDIARGDRIIVSSRAYRSVDGYAQHGWNVIEDNLTFRHVNIPVVSVTTDGSPCTDPVRWSSGTVTCTSGDGPFTFVWTRNGQPAADQPRVTITNSPDGRSSTLSISPVLASDYGMHHCRVDAPGGSVVTGFSLVDFAPFLVGSLVDVEICRQNAANVWAFANSASPLTYQWQIQDSTQTPPVFVNIPDGVTSIGGVPVLTAVNPQSAVVSLFRHPQASGAASHRIRCAVSNDCGTETTEPATLFVRCAVDFNCNGELGVQDLFDFLFAWFNADPQADFNDIGTVSVQDLFDFLAAWFAGC